MAAGAGRGDALSRPLDKRVALFPAQRQAARDAASHQGVDDVAIGAETFGHLQGLAGETPRAVWDLSARTVRDE